MIVIVVESIGGYVMYDKLTERNAILKRNFEVKTFDCNQSKKVEQLEIDLLEIELRELENKGLVDAIHDYSDGNYTLSV